MRSPVCAADARLPSNETLRLAPPVPTGGPRELVKGMGSRVIAGKYVRGLYLLFPVVLTNDLQLHPRRHPDLRSTLHLPPRSALLVSRSRSLHPRPLARRPRAAEPFGIRPLLVRTRQLRRQAPRAARDADGRERPRAEVRLLVR